MTITFTHGFIFKGFNFGWHDNTLYRMPSSIGNRLYGLRKLNEIKVGNTNGYHIKREKKSKLQVEQMTKPFKPKVNVFVFKQNKK